MRTCEQGHELTIDPDAYRDDQGVVWICETCLDEQDPEDHTFHPTLTNDVVRSALSEVAATLRKITP